MIDNTKDLSEFDCLIGARGEHIIQYFGKPDAFAQSMMLYLRDSASMIVLIEPVISEVGADVQGMITACASGILFFSPDDELLYAKGVRVLTKEEVTQLLEETDLRDVAATYGQFFTGIGSMRSIPAYFTDSGTIVLLHTNDEKILYSQEVPLKTFFGMV